MAEDDRSSEVRGIAVAFLVLAWMSVAVRTYVRYFMLNQFGRDDWVMVAAAIFFSLYISSVLLGAHYGTGQHLKYITLHNAEQAMKFWYFAECTYISASAMIKVAIASFYLRFSRDTMSRRIVYTVMATNIIFGIGLCLLFIFQCHPRSYFWSQFFRDTPGFCLSSQTIINVTYGQGGVILLSDLTLSLIPVLLLWNVQMSIRMKITVGMVMSLGGIACIATLIRFKTIGLLAHNPDFLYATTDTVIWSTIEPAMGIIAGCLATFRPLIRKCAQATTSVVRKHYNHKSNTPTALEMQYEQWRGEIQLPPRSRQFPDLEKGSALLIAPMGLLEVAPEEEKSLIEVMSSEDRRSDSLPVSQRALVVKLDQTMPHGDCSNVETDGAEDCDMTCGKAPERHSAGLDLASSK